MVPGTEHPGTDPTVIEDNLKTWDGSQLEEDVFPMPSEMLVTPKKLSRRDMRAIRHRFERESPRKQNRVPNFYRIGFELAMGFCLGLSVFGLALLLAWNAVEWATGR